MARLDNELVERRLARSRSQARLMILESAVEVDGIVCTKPSKEVTEITSIVLRKPFRFVSRGGEKLDYALTHFGVSLVSKDIIDIGSSTGGFTDCALSKGANSVTAIDVGSDQFDSQLREDSRVTLYEQTDIRNFASEKLFDVAVVDVSFISLKNIVEDIDRLLKLRGEGVLLVKPQFEVGKGNLNRQGIVKNESLYTVVVQEIQKVFEAKNFSVSEFVLSPVIGGAGNKEFLVYIKKTA